MSDLRDQQYWNDYYARLKDSEKDFLKDVWFAKYKDMLGMLENKNALDLGCGLGQDSIWYADNGFRPTACDFTESALDRLRELRPDVSVVKLDMEEALPFEEGAFGIVNANMSLHYFNWEKTVFILNEIHRVLSPRGFLIARVNSDKNGYVNDDFVQIEKDYYFDAAHGQHKRLFNREQFDLLTTKWIVVLLQESETVRKGKKKYTWEFILKKI